jgi:PAS domain S-box-containing protein
MHDGPVMDPDAPKEGRYSRIFQLLPDGVLVARADDGSVMEVNRAFEELTGYGPGSIVGKPVVSIVSALDPGLWHRLWGEAQRNGEVCGLRTRLLRQDGRIALVRISMRPVEIDGLSCHMTTIHESSGSAIMETEDEGCHGESSHQLENPFLPHVDIDQEDVGELVDFQALQQLMNSFYKATGIATAITDLDGNVRVATGWQDICVRFHRLHPETLANCKESDTCLAGTVKEGEYALYKCKNGLWDLVTPIVVSGRHIANFFLGQFFFADEVPDYDFFRNQAERYGFDTQEYLAALDRVPRWSRDLVENVLEFNSRLAMLISRLSIGNIRLTRALAERKRAEDELLLSKFCIDNAGIGIYQTFEQQISSANDFACRSLGYSLEELRSMSVFDIDPAVTMARLHEIRDTLEATGTVTHETVHRRKDGSTYPVEITTNMVEFNGKKYGISFVKDITERKQAEEALRESEQKFRVLAETAPAAIAVFQGEDFVYVNSPAVSLFGYGEAELLRMKFWELGHPEYRETIRQRGMARQRGESLSGRYEHRFVKKNGETGWVMVSAATIEYGGRPAGIAVYVDITENKHAEEKMKAAFAEKVVLLREVHHRVKNNLQIISSLLDLQSDYLGDEQSRAIIRESQNRIRSMALIHQKLYQSESYAFVNFREYIEELATDLFATYAREPHLIQLAVAVGDVTLGMDDAIPCGLIVNELLSNSLKHAFPDGRRGVISVKCHAVDDGRVALTVADTGVGLPSGFDRGKIESLGLQLVDMLVRQLAGTVTIDGNRDGTVASVVFPVKRPV